MLTQKEWLEYINRLQERERQKITSGGLNNWVIAAALLGLAYWLHPDIVSMQKHWSIVLVGYAVFTNVALLLFDVFNIYIRGSKIQNFYSSTNKKLDHKGVVILQFFDITVSTLNLIINVTLFILSSIKSYRLFELYFILYSLRYLFDIALFIYSKLKNRMFETFYVQVYIEKWMAIVKLYSIFFWLSFSIFFNLYLVIQITITIDFNNLLWKQIFNGFVISIIIILIQFMITIFIKRIKIEALEQLEKEIILKSLNEKEIINRLKNGYYSSSNIDNYFG